MLSMLSKRTRHTNTNLALFTKEPHLFIRMRLTHDILLNLELIDTMTLRNLHLLMGLHARSTHQLLALDAFGRSVALLVVDALANVAEGHFRGSL